jgi:glutamate-ammonia-ligase adenylyltransferase
MKLGRGGIREIEFFTQTRQLIAGGRDPDLRVRGTVEGLAAGRQGLGAPRTRPRSLPALPRPPRGRAPLQMIADAQTHDLPKDAEGLRPARGLMGSDRRGAAARDRRAARPRCTA